MSQRAQEVLQIVRRWIAFVGLRRVISATLSSLVLGVILWLVFRPTPAPVESFLPMVTVSSASTTQAPSTIAVHVAGAVTTPGVYVLSHSSRVIDAVIAAGGALAQADLEQINLAQILHDTEQVFIPRRPSRVTAPTIAPRHRPTTTLPTAQLPESVDAGTNLVNLNTATTTQLDALPGIGPATAKAIIDYRSKKGVFARVEDLLNVPGIGPSKLAAIKDLLTVT